MSVERIAIVGMAGRFPGARNPAELWANLRNGVESITPLSDAELLANGVEESQLADENYVKASAILPDMDRFDAGFFGFSPRDASILDPQHRHFLECAWEALEDAGHIPENFPGSVGVYAGCGMNAYMMFNLVPNRKLMQEVGLFLVRHTGNDKDFLSTRLSYELNLRGPSLSIQTACSTSLVAIHVAAQSLLNGECDMALAGGVTIENPHGQGYLYQEGEILSHDGHCRSFAADSTGTVFGSGVGVVVLRRLSDALADGDTIHAVLLGSAVNNDGSTKVGYLAPSVDGQAAAVEEALAIAGVEADTIGYVEAHGTGTSVGDPIEIEALTEAFRHTTDKNQFCAIGSLKSNIGHLDTAAGVAGVIKSVLSMKHRELPPSLHFEKPNPLIPFAKTPFVVNHQLRPWTAGSFPRRAGVNSLGVGGTNAHVILEEAPAQPSQASARPNQLLLLSARSESALNQAAARLSEFLPGATDNFADVCHTLRAGRRVFAQRRIAICTDPADARAVLSGQHPERMISGKALESDPKVSFLFAGGGSQHPNMGRDIYESEPVYREALDRCLAFLEARWKLSLKQWIFPDAAHVDEARKQLERPSLALPALLATQYALTCLWRSWGVEPESMIGHSMGEYTAALLAGVFSLEDALSLVAVRGQLFEKVPPGGMLNVPMPEEELRALLGGRLSIAAVNGPSLCVVSGESAAIDELQKELAARDIECKRIHISVAAHSQMLEPILKEFGDYVATLKLNAPQLPFVSNVSGKWADAVEVRRPDYWVQHLRYTVRFASGVTELLRDASRILIEVGPSQTLSSLAKLQPGAAQRVLASLPRASEHASPLGTIQLALGQLWLAGKKIDWALFRADEKRLRVSLPTYPFEKQRYWIDAPKPSGEVAAASAGPKRSDRRQWLSQPVWRKTQRKAQTLPEPSVWLVFGPADALQEELRQAKQEVIQVHCGGAFAQVSANHYVLDPNRPEDYAALFESLAGRGALPRKVLYAWSLADVAGEREKRNFYWPLYLTQAIANQGSEDAMDAGFLASAFVKVPEQQVAVQPFGALICGPARVLAREVPSVRSVVIDLGGVLDLEAAREVIAEMFDGGADSVVALRGRERWTETMLPMRLEDVAAPLPRGAVYLITGGLGGVALTVAESLAAQGAKLALVGRTELPERSSWDRYVTAHGPLDGMSVKIRKVQSLEKAGAQVLVLSADAADAASIGAAAAKTRKHFGDVDAVIHAAGILDDSPIALKTADSAARVLAPKVAGTINLDAAFRDQAKQPLMVLFSSTSALLAPPGQVDYVAANAFLDAYANHRPSTMTVNWGMWGDVGMMAMGTAGGVEAHPLLGVKITDSPERVVFEKQYRVSEMWVLDEHRVEGGHAVLPGVAYAEIAHAAMASIAGKAVALEIKDIVWSSPLQVNPANGRTVRVTLEKEAGGWLLIVNSSVDGVRWAEHGRAQLGLLKSAAPAANLGALRAAHTARSLHFDAQTKTQQERHIRFGPRWRVLERIDLAAKSAFAKLSLPEAFHGDLKHFNVHPALLDLAMGFGLPVIQGYEKRDDFYVPLSFKSMCIYGPLPTRFFSHAVCAEPTQSDVGVFDVTLIGETGKVLIEVKEFVMRKVSAAALASETEGETPFLELLRAGSILAAEGRDVFAKILAGSRASRVIVSPIEIAALAAALERSVSSNKPAQASTGDNAARYVAPRNAVEEKIASIWQQVLGVARVGIHDDFFDLGGHSLIAVRVFGKVRKEYNLNFGLATLFQARTVSKLAKLISDQIEPAQNGETAPSTLSFKNLVPIRPGGSKPPLYMIHGAGGNVVTFEPVMKYIDAERPLYGLQAVGVDGSARLLRSVEEMAAAYLSEIRQVQPHGPYAFVGYSFGGMIGFEMAQQLHAAGERSSFVGMLDTNQQHFLQVNADRNPKGRSTVARLQGHFMNFVRDPKRWDYVAGKIGLYYRNVVKSRFYELYFKAGLPLPKSADALGYLNPEAGQRYQPKYYPGQITVLRAIHRHEGDPYDYTLGWTGCAGDVKVVEVQGAHDTMVQEPNVKSLGKTIGDCISQAEKDLEKQGSGELTTSGSSKT